ncbi:Rpn family recombination-promoting nuclease/putative transposase [Salinispira pacifica]|nr:Rpn family recombination-promoting nuclease/putative transposase [Salinispira pacifica]
MAERKPWDSAYKFLFSSKQVFHQFLTRFVEEDFVQGLAVDDVELVDKSFVSEELLDRESDIIYKVTLPGREVYVYVLLEFQSTPDKTIPVRMLLYILQLYDQLFRSSTKGLLPAVFPVLLYNGSLPWTVPFNISELIAPEIPQKYIPSFAYYPIIERDIPPEKLERIKGLVAAIIYLEQQEDDAALRRTIDKAISMIAEEKPEQLRQFSHWINRMFRGSLENRDIDKVNQLTEVKTMLAEVVDRIEQRGEQRGVQQGIQQGMQQGMQQKAREDARKMLERGFPIADISEITGLSEQEIKKL